ncbi:MAG TPA: site-2 protease family protein [Candidatus Pacearchaeota archaeon]|nr:site-2 protease family protein [Candidatus Pacearchaeota archaeon]HOK94478.1 site-2 protease family protein [Candidatus Pacearchaeota archaeon]HPO75278.1 site-2 protease family protein [Candidatus Pacearchaeota archaeon]
MADIVTLIFIFLIFYFSMTVHEVAHGAVASILGDPTAKLAGRLTLNPLKHIDLLGSVILPGILILMSAMTGGNGIIFGWAKPVPYNPDNLRDKKYGRAKVGAAGPLSNFLIAIIFGLCLRFFPESSTSFFQNLQIFFQYVVWVNLLFFVFNLWPAPPFDGHHILFSFVPSLESKTGIFKNPLLSMFIALLFMDFIGLPYICPWLFQVITGMKMF